ncbi:hypothetical protein DRN97_06915 [Methanosarcinales archaeon]|nr:MAG: hypothetical protein DRN97_06915 [Methanosarcinales archaeon]
MGDTMKVGIVGCGKVAKGYHIPALLKIEGVKIAAVCDMSEAEAKRTANMFNIDRSYTDLSDMLKREDLEMLDICTPPQTHASLSIQAMEEGCHVLIEKPLTLSVGDAEKIILASKKSGAKLCIVHNYLFKPITMRAKAIVEDGGLGDLLGIDVKFLNRKDNVFMSRDHWCHNLPGGRFGENIIHPLYLIDGFLDITDIVAARAKKLGNYDWVSIDELKVLLDAKNSMATISLSSNVPKDVETVDIYGTEGILHLDFHFSILIKHGPKKLTRFSPIASNLSLSFKRLTSAVSFPVKVIKSKKYIRSGHYYLIQKFVESIRDDKVPPVTGDKGRKMIALQEKIFDLVTTQ